MPEVEWDEQEQGWMLALQMHRASLCPGGCGHKLVDTTSRGKDGPKFHVPPPTRCRACDALAIAQDGSNRPHPVALLWRVEKR